MNLLPHRLHVQSCAGLTLVLAFFATCSRSAAQAQAKWWQDERPSTSEAVESNVGIDPAAWRVTDAQGMPVDPALEKIGPYTALSNHTKQPLNVIGIRRYEPNTEITARFKLNPPAGAAATVSLEAALPGPDDPSNGAMALTITSSATAGSVGYDCRSKGKPISGTYQFRPDFKRSLSWPEDVRKTVEQNMSSLAPPEEKWLTVRLVLKPRRFQFFLDDRLVEDKTTSGLDVGGFVRLRLSPHASLAAVHARPIRSMSRSDSAATLTPRSSEGDCCAEILCRRLAEWSRFRISPLNSRNPARPAMIISISRRAGRISRTSRFTWRTWIAG